MNICFVFLVAFIIIGVTVFAVDSLVYVDRLKINNNEGFIKFLIKFKKHFTEAEGIL